MTKSWCETDSKALDRKEYYQERRLKDLQLDLPWEARIYTCSAHKNMSGEFWFSRTNCLRNTCVCIRLCVLPSCPSLDASETCAASTTFASRLPVLLLNTSHIFLGGCFPLSAQHSNMPHMTQCVCVRCALHATDGPPRPPPPASCVYV